MKLRAEIWEWLKTIAFSVVVVIVVHFYGFNLSTVEGHSMEPTLTEKEWLFVNKFIYLVSSPKFGDVVILEEPYPDNRKKRYLVKRIVGVPGDRIEIADKRLYRNGIMTDEPYTDALIEDLDYGPVVLGKDQYFVMGDNRHARASMDSRTFNAIDEELIHGRAEFVLWPFGQIRSL